MPDTNMLPVDCITASALYSLAAALNRLRAWHMKHSGMRKHEPCLRMIRWDLKLECPIAVVFSGDIHWTLLYKKGEWIFQ